MDMSGDRLIAAPREKVWDALNDPEILKQCIPGCETMEKLSDTQLKATAAVKLGPIAARFTGNVLLSDLDPPNGYTISGEGQGGVAGFAKGGASVKLTDEEGGTRLSYVVNAQIGGKMAQLGARLIDSTAKQMAEAFFTKFSAILAPEPAMTETTESPYHKLAEDHDHDPSNPHYFGLPLGVIIAAVLATIAVGLTVLKYH
ncbi:MAG: carbon monoxide dehydrogenase subunit G [Acidocella sp.]|jgi:carbon monoxide dehydrogenase subunit G|nr:carbon monoxide dehydrogenase subunit G [Acidocella sp.]